MAGKKGSYLGGSTIVKKKPWLLTVKPPKRGRLGIISIAAADADTFVPKTYVVRAEDREIAEDQKPKTEKPPKSVVRRKRSKTASDADPLVAAERAKNAEAIKERQAKKMAGVVVERKKARPKFVPK